MNTPVPLVIEYEPKNALELEHPSALERLRYLCPSRYFRFFMFYERNAKRTCWLPEGYDL